MLYGFHPVREALRQRPREIARVLVGARAGGRRREIENLCRQNEVAVEPVDPARLDELVGGGVHNGFVAELRSAGRPVERDEAGGDADLVVLLEDVQDPRNLGAILRVCEGAGVGRVLIRDRGSAPVNAAAVKTSAGAAEHLGNRVERITNSSQTLELLKDEGFWAYGADAEGRAPWSAELTGKVVLVLGGEEKGLRRRTRETCDVLLGLPMRGRVESLNVATAASALLYEALRQRLGTHKRRP